MANTPDLDSRRAQMFPRLSEEQIARLARLARRRPIAAGEVLFDQGERVGRFFIVVSGEVEIGMTTAAGEYVVTVHGPGQFTGETNMLTGRRSLVRGRVRAPGEVLELELDQVRALVQTDAELSELFMRAFILRRMGLIAFGQADAVLVGSQHSAGTLRIKEFLTRNGEPFSYVDVDADPSVSTLLERFHVGVDEVPLLICHGRTLLKNPSNAEVAERFGLSSDMHVEKVHDVLVVGAGPAGLAAAVYAASEGLDVLVLEADAPGGQAGTSSKIENYLGFPTGISGGALAGRAYTQAAKFGANIAIARTAVRLDCSRRPFELTLGDGRTVRGRSVVIATGARYNKLQLPGLERFEGAGVYYGATHLEAQLCSGGPVIVVGGGNSAGQAAVFLAGTAVHVHMLVRGGSLAASMSRYLIRRIEETGNITLRTRCQIESLEGEGRLERVIWRDATGARTSVPIQHVFVMTGASPHTDWLAGCVDLDDKGFVKTGLDLDRNGLASRPRPPLHLETSVPGVFAVGDVRAGSIKRIAAAVGEGATVVALIHRVLAEG